MQGGGCIAALTQINGYAHVAERYGFEEGVIAMANELRASNTQAQASA